MASLRKTIIATRILLLAGATRHHTCRSRKF